MLKNLGRSKIRDGYIRVLDEIKAEYHRVNKPIRVKASEYRNKKISSVGKHIILSGHEPVKEGTLIQLKFDLKGWTKHRFGDYNILPKGGKFIGIGQVLRILESDDQKYRMLIRLLDLCPAQ